MDSCTCARYFSGLCAKVRNNVICILQIEKLSYGEVNCWVQISSLLTVRLQLYGPHSTTQTPALTRDIIYCLPFFSHKKETTWQSCWQGILSLWGYAVFSSYYCKPWFIPFGPQFYFAQHENKVNYILESFANEILKEHLWSSSLLCFSAVLRGKGEVQYIKPEYLSFLALQRDCYDGFEADDGIIQPPNSVKPQQGLGSGIVKKQN